MVRLGDPGAASRPSAGGRMSRRPWIKVVVEPVNHAAWVSGWKAYELIVGCGGRPIWSRRRKAWSTSEHTAVDVLAMAELDGYAVQYELIGRDAR